MKRSALLLALAAAAGLAVPAQARGPLDVRLNQVQVLGTHNSYHIQPIPPLISLYLLFDPRAFQWEYTHRPLGEQFALLGIRQIELDVYADPVGGLFAEPLGLEVLTGGVVHLPALDPPGMKVIHVADLDFDSTCVTFVECLTAVKAWSDANPEHLPLMVLVEAKDDPPPMIDPSLGLTFVFPIPFGAGELDDLDAEIRSVFPPDQLITPDDVRGAAPTLEAAILGDGWPTVREARGRVLFALDNGGSTRDAYVAGHPALAGRVMFTDSPAGDPEAAFVKLNDPLANRDLISDLVLAGYIVRTRADANTFEARDGDTRRRNAALASGAHFVSTDYPELGPFGTDYVVTIPGGSPARCNPINAPRDCLSSALENLTGFQPVSGTQLAVRDRDGDPRRRKIAARARDPLIETPLPGSANDPSFAGATLELRNPLSGESAQFVLPPGPEWRGLGRPAGAGGYVYRDLRGRNGPCGLLYVKRGRQFRVTCRGKLGAIPFSLDEPSQQTLAVTLQLGGATSYCASFGGEVLKDVQATNGGVGVFLAKNSAPGACPP